MADFIVREEDGTSRIDKEESTSDELLREEDTGVPASDDAELSDRRRRR